MDRLENQATGAEPPKRGIAPPILISYVRNTAPFIFQGEAPRNAPYWRILQLAAADAEAPLTHFEYYRLCVAAHHGTVATFVPTDVDNQIRFRLWHPALPTEILWTMAKFVLGTREWDPRSVSARWMKNDASTRVLSGHDGEWFSTAAGAYGALRKRAPSLALEVADAIIDEMEREGAIYAEARRTRDGIGMLKAATVIAHNLGDLDRVMDMWNLPEDDPMRARAYKAGHEGSGALAEAGRLNKALMADENHRHFALRKPKCLRVSPELLIPMGPFFDEWGSIIARHPELTPENVAEIAEALVDGWNFLAAKGPSRPPAGYARALAGIIESFPGGASELASHMPSRIAKQIQAGQLHQLIKVPRARFEEQWRHMALKIVGS